MAYDRESLRKKFPHLATELDKNIMKVSIDSARTTVDDKEKTVSRKTASYNPDIIDFLRRCDTNEEAIEIVDFIEKRGEISKEYGKRLREQLNEEGVRSFGAKKGDDYYFYYFNQKKTKEDKIREKT